MGVGKKNFITLQELRRAQKSIGTDDIENVNYWLDHEDNLSTWIDGFSNIFVENEIKKFIPHVVGEELETLRVKIRDHFALTAFYMKTIFDNRTNEDLEEAYGD